MSQGYIPQAGDLRVNALVLTQRVQWRVYILFGTWYSVYGQKQAVTDSEFAPQQFSIFDKKKSTKDMVTNNTDYFSSSNACLGPSNRDLWITNFQHVIHTLRYGDRLGQN